MDRSFSETTVVVTDQEHAADTIVKVDVLEIAADRDHFADCIEAAEVLDDVTFGVMVAAEVFGLPSRGTSTVCYELC